MKKRPILLLFYLLSFNILLAQTNFKDGGIILQKGDTIRGQVDYREWTRNPAKINFRSTATAKSSCFDCQHLAGFFINSNNEIYLTAIVSLNMESTDTRYLPSFQSLTEANMEFRPVVDTVFLLVLVRGQMNLFEYVDKNRAHFLVQAGHGPVQELVSRTVLIQSDNSSQVAPLNDYKHQLQSITTACPSLKIDLSKVLYNKKELLEVAKKFNECVQNTGYIKPRDKTEKSLNLVAGAAYPVYLISAPFTQNKTVTAPGNIVPLIGLEYTVNFNRSRGRRGIGLGMYASKYSILKETTEANNNQVSYIGDMSYLRLFAFYRQSLKVGKIQPYLKAGAGGSHYFKSDFYYTKTFGIHEPIKYSRDTKSNDVCLLGGIGLKTKRFFMETRFEFSSNMAFYDLSEFLKANLFSIVAGYRLLN